MFEGKKYDIATFILLLFFVYEILGGFTTFLAIYPLNHLVLTSLFLINYLILSVYFVFEVDKYLFSTMS